MASVGAGVGGLDFTTCSGVGAAVTGVAVGASVIATGEDVMGAFEM